MKMLLLLLFLNTLFSSYIVSAQEKVVSPNKLLAEVLAENYNFKGSGLLSSYFSEHSCLFTSENFILLKNYCFTKPSYPAKSFTILSPDYGVFQLYQEIDGTVQFRNFRINVFQENLMELINRPIVDMEFNKINTILDKYYEQKMKACYATNLSRYTGDLKADCVNVSIEDIPLWRDEALSLVLDQKAWAELIDQLYAKTKGPEFAFSLTQIYEGRGNIQQEALYTPIKRYADIVQGLQALEAAYPNNAEVFQLGLSNLGEPIYGLKVGSGPVHNLVVGTHHGNEYGSAEVAEAVAKDFAAKPISGQTIYIIPVLNTNGYDRRSRAEKNEAGVGIDPNRDYPGPCGTSGPFRLRSTQALASFLDEANIVNSVTLHTYYPGVLYPWGISTHDLDTEYTDIFKELGLAAASFSNYKVGNSTEELYPADGTFEDYAFWQHGVWSLLFEMGFTHNPSPDQVKAMVEVNVPGIRKLFDNSPLVRAQNHSFKGQCNGLSLLFDRRDE